MCDQPKVQDYYNQVAAEYYKIYQPEKMSYKLGIDDYFRLQILLRLLEASAARSVYEVGVGDGTPLATMHRMGLRVAGCDIAINMVDRARRFQEMGVENPNIILADTENSTSVEGKGGPGYDAILAKFHNPLEIPGLLRASRFGGARFHWYQFHAAPPWLAEELGDLFDAESVKLEHHTDDWRGIFLCSAVLVDADAE